MLKRLEVQLLVLGWFKYALTNSVSNKLQIVDFTLQNQPSKFLELSKIGPFSFKIEKITIF